MNGDDLATAAARITASGALGRSAVLQKLFDFLLERSAAGAAPKEAEVAVTVFGDSLRPNAPQDASVRVYIHRLRQKLAEYYDGPGKDDAVCIEIPKGEYRLVLRGTRPTPLASKPRRVFEWSQPWVRLGAGFIVLLVFNLAAWILWTVHGGANEIERERRTAPWVSLLQGHHPITLVLGDYYIFGEVDRQKGVDRLVREYSINSPIELDDYRMAHPDVQSRYVDLDLYYLPVASATALRNIMPLLAPTARDRDLVRVVLASDVTPEMLRHNDIVYVGYLSGLGALRDPVFAGSRFSVGETYDVLIDQVAQKRYASQEGGPNDADQQQRDLGYFATFRGPAGNHIIVIAGARDMGMTQTAEEATNPTMLAQIQKAVRGADAFEALFDVQGIRRSNLGGHLVVAAPLKADRIWSAQPSEFPFPKG
jgi:hypothetical protein